MRKGKQQVSVAALIDDDWDKLDGNRVNLQADPQRVSDDDAAYHRLVMRGFLGGSLISLRSCYDAFTYHEGYFLNALDNLLGKSGLSVLEAVLTMLQRPHLEKA